MPPSSAWHTRQTLLLRHVADRLAAAQVPAGYRVLAGYLGTPGEDLTALILWPAGSGSPARRNTARAALRPEPRWTVRAGRALGYLIVQEPWADPQAQAEAAWLAARDALDTLLLAYEAQPHPVPGFAAASWAEQLTRAGKAEDAAFAAFALYLPHCPPARALDDKEFALCLDSPTNGPRAGHPVASASAPPATRPTDLRRQPGGRMSQ